MIALCGFSNHIFHNSISLNTISNKIFVVGVRCVRYFGINQL